MTETLFAPPVAPAPHQFFSLVVEMDKIVDAPKFNPRRDYGEDDGTFAALVESIRERGMLQLPRLSPVSVPPGYSIDTDKGDVDIMGEMTWHIISGHRRIAAARALGWTQIECSCLGFEYEADVTAYSESERLIDALVENLQRKELNCIEVAEGIARLERMGRTQEQIATLISRSQGRVSRLVRLLDLPVGVRTHLRLGSLSRTAGEELIPLIGSGLLPGEIDALAEKAVEAGLSAVALASVVRQRLEALQPKQAELFGANKAPETPQNVASGATPVAHQATSKGQDAEPKPAPKDTNGLTRKDADAQFAEAMAPDPDVPSLSSLPAPQTTEERQHHAEQQRLAPIWLEDTALDLLPRVRLLPDYQGISIDEVAARLILERAAQLGVTPPGQKPQPTDSPVSMKDDAFHEALWKTLANHGQEALLLGFRLPTERGTVRRFGEMVAKALGEGGGWERPGTGWVIGRITGGTWPRVELEYNHGDGFANTHVFLKNGDLLTAAEKAIAWKHAQIAATATRAQEGDLQRQKELADQAAAAKREEERAAEHQAREDKRERRSAILKRLGDNEPVSSEEVEEFRSDDYVRERWLATNAFLRGVPPTWDAPCKFNVTLEFQGSMRVTEVSSYPGAYTHHFELQGDPNTGVSPTGYQAIHIQTRDIDRNAGPFTAAKVLIEQMLQERFKKRRGKKAEESPEEPSAFPVFDESPLPAGVFGEPAQSIDATIDDMVGRLV